MKSVNFFKQRIPYLVRMAGRSLPVSIEKVDEDTDPKLEVTFQEEEDDAVPH